MRVNRRGLRRAIGIGLLGMPAAAFLLGNLWLACPPGRHWIAGKIQHRTGLETRVAGASFTPWNGVCLRQVDLLQPVPLRQDVSGSLARIAIIRLAPVWRSWLHGKPEMRVVEIDSPQLVVPMELLAELVRSHAPATPATPALPPLATASPPTLTQPTLPQPATPPTASTAAPATPATPSNIPAVALPPTTWLHVKNASFTLLAASSGKKWIELSGVSGALPLAGSPATSTLSIHTIQLAGHETLTDLHADLDWKSPVLSLNPLTTDVQGIQLILAAKLAMLNGFPLQLEAQAPRQKLAACPLPADGHIEAASILANARFRGLLLAPGTWQGELVAETTALSGGIAGHEAKFDHGYAVAVLNGGQLSCLDARLIGDDLSFLGNATLLADGRIAAVLRMVAPPEAATAIIHHTFPNMSPPPSPTPLSTPQRTAFDLLASGNIGRLSLQLGQDGPVVELQSNTP